ncbi:hypothetical protein E2P81_ATG07497 [Venturia nashicola]|uniref:Uncharacterized protein n=1 Tax=Venturia nashicola TaxID=86259 RepID=A0A4Z1NZD7_9PEZI|nr:hypothetical protein E6O75_ATG07652 [Venturia nashicola]TLD32007.1 hypothetical protein E2P81_ATG07497 [Venturia nashicola]
MNLPYATLLYKPMLNTKDQPRLSEVQQAQLLTEGVQLLLEGHIYQQTHTASAVMQQGPDEGSLRSNKHNCSQKESSYFQRAMSIIKRTPLQQSCNKVPTRTHSSEKDKQRLAEFAKEKEVRRASLLAETGGPTESRSSCLLSSGSRSRTAPDAFFYRGAPASTKTSTATQVPASTKATSSTATAKSHASTKASASAEMLTAAKAIRELSSHTFHLQEVKHLHSHLEEDEDEDDSIWQKLNDLPEPVGTARTTNGLSFRPDHCNATSPRYLQDTFFGSSSSSIRRSTSEASSCQRDKIVDSRKEAVVIIISSSPDKVNSASEDAGRAPSDIFTDEETARGKDRGRVIISGQS